MNYLITSYMDNQEKEKVKSKGLYCYDLRHSDDGTEIATIERSVLINRVGSITTNEELTFDDTDCIDFEEFSSENTQVDTIEQLLKSKKIYKMINGYEIYKEGTWCEVVKNNQHIFDGNVDEKMTFEQIYQEIKKEVVFSLNDRDILSYDLLNEFAGERESTIEQLAQENKCNVTDIKVRIRTPNLKEKIIQKSRLLKNYNNEYPYNVQIWNSIDGGNKFLYSGNGKFFKTKKEAETYMNQLEKQGIKKEKFREREAR